MLYIHILLFLTVGRVFQQPLEISSENGSLNLTLDVDIGEITLDWLTIKRRLYNNSFPAPTLRIKAGDEIHLKLVFVDLYRYIIR